MTDIVSELKADRRAGPLLQVKGLRKSFSWGGEAFRARRNRIRAVDGVDLTIGAGESVALVGESGCGKTTLGLLIVRLLEPDAGQVSFQGVDLVRLTSRQLKPYRRALQIVFQDSLSALDPLLTIGSSIEEALRAFGSEMPKSARSARTMELLDMVDLDGDLVDRFPHQVSAGQRQRASIARALAVEPRLLICDEIVSALDASTRNRILDLLHRLRSSQGLACLIISHDLHAVRRVADRTLIMADGAIVEEGPTSLVLTQPSHPYTQELLRSMLSVDPSRPNLFLGGHTGEEQPVSRSERGIERRSAGAVERASATGQSDDWTANR